MTGKFNSIQTGIVSVFALTLALTSPSFAQCVGNSCAIQQSAPCAPCARSYAYAQTAPRYAYQTQTCGTFAPFGGFFRNLFGGCGCQYAAQNGGACFSRLSGAAEPKGQFARECSACGPTVKCSGATCLADPVGRESAPDATTDEEFATGEKYELVPGDESVPPHYKKVESAPCEAVEKSEEEPCEPCGAVRATWLEKKLFDCANAQRRANGLRPFLFDGRLIQWARFNSSLQARYCRLGHFSGYAAEIAGEGYTTPEAAVEGWLDSAPHRLLLLNGGYSRCGCACYQGANGSYYWTMSFGN